MAGPTLSCSTASREAGEPQAGSAVAGVRVWLLLEHAGPWAPDALESPQLPESVRTHVRAFLGAVAGSRFQLVRRLDGEDEGAVAAFLIDADRDAPRVLQWTLSDLAELRDVDLHAALEAGRHPRASVRETPLHLVCTHGKRDRCCALFGVPLARAMAALAPEGVFQTSHVGGHRFAPNVLSFPEGVCYGRLGVEDASGLVEAHGRGAIYRAEALRGRMRFDPPAQAAEIFLRQRTGILDAGAPRLLSIEAEGDGRWRVRLELGGREHEVAVRSLPPGALRPASCGAAPTPSSGFAPA